MSLLKILSKIASNVPGKKKMIFHMASNRGGFHIRLFTAMSSKFQSPKEYSLSFTNSSKKSLYISLLLSSLIYISFFIQLKSILDMYFALYFYMYVSVIASNVTYMF
jgi:hypothetical protein